MSKPNSGEVCLSTGAPKCKKRFSLQQNDQGYGMKESTCRNYDELPLFLNVETVAQVLSVSPSSGYELIHEPGFPVLRIGGRMVVPKEKFIQRAETHT